MDYAIKLKHTANTVLQQAGLEKNFKKLITNVKEN